MGSDEKTRVPGAPEGNRPGRVRQDERGHSVWEGTIRTIKLSIMKTGIFRGAKVQKALQELQDQGKGNSSIDPSDELDLSVTEVGFDPYNSDLKK